MKITREDIEADGMRVESFFGTDVIVMHEGCGGMTAIMEALHGGERYYVACVDCSEGCLIDFVAAFSVLFGNPVRALFNDNEGNSQVKRYAD